MSKNKINWVAIENQEGGFVLHTHNPETINVPKITWKEYLSDDIDFESLNREELLMELGSYGISEEDLGKNYDSDSYELEYWDSNPTTGPIFMFLYSIDVNKKIKESLIFYDGPFPGSNYCAVEVPDIETLEELGEELDHLGN